VQTFGLPPTLLAFDPVTHQLIPVRTSQFAAVPQTPAALGNNRFRVTITFDATSQPKLTQLLGTLFTFVAPRTEPEREQSPQTPFWLASNAQAMFDLAAAPQQSFGLQRSGFSGGSDTLLVTAPSRATELDPGVGGEPDRTDTGFIPDMLFQLHRGFWQSGNDGG